MNEHMPTPHVCIFVATQLIHNSSIVDIIIISDVLHNLPEVFVFSRHLLNCIVHTSCETTDSDVHEVLRGELESVALFHKSIWHSSTSMGGQEGKREMVK